MVGGHPSCQIQIDKPGTPDLVYVVFSFNETIEVWPTTAIAFPHWGPLPSNQSVMIGGMQIQFKQQVDETPHFKNYHRSSMMHILDFDGGASKKKSSVLLDNRVQIVGGDHPSTIRIRDVGLSNCEQAIVNFDECCWQINLRQNISEPDRVKQIFVDDQMSIGMLKAEYRTKSGEARKTSSGSSTLESLIPIEPAAAKLVNAQETLHPERENHLVDEADEITEAITDRLVTLNRTRSLRSKVVQWGLWLLMVAAAGGILAWMAKELTPLNGGL